MEKMFRDFMYTLTSVMRVTIITLAATAAVCMSVLVVHFL